MKITHIILFAVISAAQSSFSHAETPLYLDILLGSADQEQHIAGEPQIKGKEISIGLRLGYQIIDQLAIEFGYHDYGEYTAAITRNGNPLNVSVETTSFNLGFKGVLPLSERVDLNARLGAFRWDYREDEVSFDSRFKGDDDGIDIYFGLQYLIRVSDFMDIGVEYTVLDHEASTGNQTFDRDVRNTAFFISYGL